MARRITPLRPRALAVAVISGGLAVVGLASSALAVGEDGGNPPPVPPSAQLPENAPPAAAPIPGERAHRQFDDPVGERIKYLHSRLRIAPAQEGAWSRVAEVMRENGKTVAPFIKERLQSAEHGTAIQSLEAYERLGEAQLGDLKKFNEAFRTLYDSLSAEQKKIADSIFRIGPLSMIGGIPDSPEAPMTPGPGEYTSPLPSYAGVPPTGYPGYAYSAPYAYGHYPPYPPYYGPWFWGAPLGLGVGPFFVHGPFFHHPFFHGPFLGGFHGGFHRR